LESESIKEKLWMLRNFKISLRCSEIIKWWNKSLKLVSDAQK